MSGRGILFVVLVAGVAGVVGVLSSGPDGPEPPTSETGTTDGNGNGSTPAAAADDDVTFVRSEQCADCHADVYSEWTGSYHAQAWTDPMVQSLSKGFRMTECIDCHAPQPIHLTGVDQRVAPRGHDRQAGVDCLTCHLMPDGRSVAAGRDVDTSATAGACRPVLVKEMTNAVACSGCHNQHATLDELLDSGLDKTCLDCHMERVERGSGDGVRAGRSHAFPGCHEQSMHRKATKLELRLEDGQVVASVTNVGAGHHIPTDARHRSYNLWVTAWDDRGNLVQPERQMENGEFRLYYRDDFKPSTQIKHGESGEGRWRWPAGLSGKARVRLTYALNPELLAQREVTEVHEAEITFE
jgi:hypothetical protein